RDVSAPACAYSVRGWVLRNNERHRTNLGRGLLQGQRSDLPAMAARHEQRCAQPRLRVHRAAGGCARRLSRQPRQSGACSLRVRQLVLCDGTAGRGLRLRIRGRIYYETLPPGLLLKQMDAGGTVTSGNMTWTIKPDVFLAERVASNDLVQQKRL